jgi:hypothetical protein
MSAVISQAMLPGNPRWGEFLDRLAGPEGCDFRADRWTCHNDTRAAQALLVRMGLSDPAVKLSLAYYRDHGGYCDCEIVFNVDPLPLDEDEA